MLTRLPEGFYQSSQLCRISGLVHGYSTRAIGDMRGASARKGFLRLLGLTDSSLIMGEQIHGSVVGMVGNVSAREILGVDGLVARSKSVPIGVAAADCVPLLLVDPTKGIVAAVHAGWRGTLANIASAAVGKMADQGSNVRDIVVSIGPHIGMCCYTVAKERIDRFVSLFGQDPKMTAYSENAWHLDIGWVNYRQLRDAGVLVSHIDAPPVCTSCQSDIFYSYRKDTKESFGEILAVIGMT